MCRARKPENYILHLDGLKFSAQKYCEFFGIEKPLKIVETLTTEQMAILKEKAKAKAKADAAKKREKWLSFETTYYYPINGKELLRMKNGTVETTKGITFTTDVAKQFFAALKANKVQTGAKFERYTVLKVSDTLIRIGCHDFDMAYLLNWGAENLAY
jgi:flagellar basal body L-ring protein FlgH